MLVGFAGALTGFNGSYDYPSGGTYPEFVPFRAMRILMAMPGVAMVPLTWGTACELGFTNWGRHIVTLMVLCGASEHFGLSWSEDQMGAQTSLFSSSAASSCSTRFSSSSPFASSTVWLASTMSRGGASALESSAELQLSPSHRPFTLDWWVWLSLTGFSIGCVARCVLSHLSSR